MLLARRHPPDRRLHRVTPPRSSRLLLLLLLLLLLRLRVSRAVVVGLVLVELSRPHHGVTARTLRATTSRGVGGGLTRAGPAREVRGGGGGGGGEDGPVKAGSGGHRGRRRILTNERLQIKEKGREAW